jgi:dihydroorotate dehydrogenase electron transfer subunit
MKNVRCTLVDVHPLAHDIVELSFTHAQRDIPYTPGQFIQLSVPGDGFRLRRPLAIAKHRPGAFSVVVQMKGEGTRRIVQAPIGTPFDALMMLGQGFSLKAQTQSLLVLGGGLGTPALLSAAKAAFEAGIHVSTVLGFRSAAWVFYHTEFERFGTVLVCTDDGSHGLKGTIARGVESLHQTFDEVIACGPHGLLRYVQATFPQAQLSLEEHMACGFGACVGCVVFSADQHENYKVCVDGPVFRADKVRL